MVITNGSSLVVITNESLASDSLSDYPMLNPIHQQFEVAIQRTSFEMTNILEKIMFAVETRNSNLAYLQTEVTTEANRVLGTIQ